MKPEVIVAICAVFIAAISLIVAIWQGILNRRHFRLSVKPHIGVHWSRFKEKPIKFTMINNGLGPAIIKRFSVFIDSAEYVSNNADPFEQSLSKLNLLGKNYLYHIPTVGEAFGVGGELILLEFEEPPEAYEELCAVLPRMKFKIIYTSIYDDKELTYFGNC